MQKLSMQSNLRFGKTIRANFSLLVNFISLYKKYDCT